MKVYLTERDKTNVPTIVEALNVRYSKSRNSLVIDGYFRWFELYISVEEAKEHIDAYINNNEETLDLRSFGAVGYWREN